MIYALLMTALLQFILSTLKAKLSQHLIKLAICTLPYILQINKDSQ